LAEADDGVGDFETGFGGGFEEGGEVREGGGEGFGDLLLAAARGEGFEGLDPGLDVGLAGPEKDVARGEGSGLGEGEEVAAAAGKVVEEDSIGGRGGLEGKGDHMGIFTVSERVVNQFLNGF
jgi:hypothetical protein